jgi:hypothetical protein
MKMRSFLVSTLLVVACVACGPKPEPKLTRDEAKAALQQEAMRMKAEGEKMPDVGVKATWTVTAVDVTERPGNDAKPWKGTVRFKIESSAHALGDAAPQAFDKSFDYVYDAAQKKWLFGT